MEEEHPDKYVSELLKQLEELKKKKAHKEKKLMKLKSCTPKNKNKTRTALAETSGSDNKLNIEIIQDENNSFVSDVTNSDICCNTFKERSLHEINKAVYSKQDINVENRKMTVLSKAINLNDKKHIGHFVYPTSELEEVKSNINVKNVPTNFKSAASKILSELENKSPAPKVGDSQSDFKNCNKSTLMSNNDNCKSKETYKSTSNSSGDNSKFKKSSIESKSPDFLDDSFNYNVSNFMSGFEAMEESKATNKDICEPISKKGCFEKKEIGVDLISADIKISPPFSLSQSFNESQKINSSAFNFPIFSTPTDMTDHVHNTKNMIYNFLEKADDMGCSKSANASKNCILKVDSFSAVQKNVGDDEFNSLQLNTLLKKELSSVLDAHYGSPTKESSFTQSKDRTVNSIKEHYMQDNNKHISGKTNNISDKKLKLKFDKHEHVYQPVLKTDSSPIFVPDPEIGTEKNITAFSKCKNTKAITELDFDQNILFSDPFVDSQDVLKSISAITSSYKEIPSQVTKAVDGLIAKVCENLSHQTKLFRNVPETRADEVMEFETDVLIVPETEGLELSCYPKCSDDFLDTSTLSQSFEHFKDNENMLNVSSQSKLDSPVVNNIVSALKLSQIRLENKHEAEIKHSQKGYCGKDDISITLKRKRIGDDDFSGAFFTSDTLAFDAAYFEEHTQDLGALKTLPNMDVDNAQECIAENCDVNDNSNLSFICSLHGCTGEPVINAEITLFNDVKYAFLQHKTQIHVWKENKSNWKKIYCHTIEDNYSLEKICLSRNANSLVIMMLMGHNKKFCLQFLVFEKDNSEIKFLENTHWLEEVHSSNSILICGLEDLMFATAHNNEVSLHAFMGLKEHTRIMTAFLGSTDDALCSICKVEKLPYALIGINNSTFYIWHVLELRLVTELSLYPHDYLPIKTCFWSTIENGVIFMLTTCEGTEEFKVCQLLAVNLSTGCCRSVITYSTLPSPNRTKVFKILKAAYLEPFLVIAHPQGAYLWSITEEFCCAALSSKLNVTTVTISKDVNSWGLVAVGTNTGHIHCYSLN